MSKSATAQATKSSALPTKSAWANGPPQSTAAYPTSRSQSPAPNNASPAIAHSRKPSALGGAVPIKDGVSVPRGTLGAAKSSGAITFGSVNDQSAPLSSSPAEVPAIRAEGRAVQSFGSIAAGAPANGKSPMSPASNLSASSASTSSTSASSVASSATTAPSTIGKPSKVDISSFFRGNGGSSAASPSSPAIMEKPTSPPVRAAGLPPHNGPNSHPHPPHSQVAPPQHSPNLYAQQFVPQGLRSQNSMNPPRSPGFARQTPNGTGAGVRPPGPGGPSGPNATSMPSPRLAPPQHTLPHQHPHAPHPGQGVPVGPPQIPWTPYYYAPYPPPGPEHYMGYPPQQWHHTIPHHPGPSPSPQSIPVSPRQPPPALPLQPPGTPPTNPITSPPPSARLNSGATAFVPGQTQRQSRVVIKDSAGHEVDFRKSTGAPSPGGISIGSSPSPVERRSGKTQVRLESPDARQKRLEAEHAKREAEEKARLAKDEEARKAKEEERLKREAAEAEKKRKEEEEKERVRKEEEEKIRLQKEEEEREKERLRKEEEEEKERLRKEEEEKERIRQEEEKERIRKEEEEKERLRLEEEEKVRQEQERIAREEAEKERLRKEEEERQVKEEEERKAAEKAAALAAAAEEERKITEEPVSELPAPAPETVRKRPIPGPLDLSSATRPGLPPALPSALATARAIQDLGQISYPEGVKSPKIELNVGAKEGKFRYDRDFLMQFMSVCKEKPDNLPPLEAIGLEPVDQTHAMNRGGSGRRGQSGSMGPPSSISRPGLAGLGFNTGPGGFRSASSGFSMGNFSTSVPGKISNEERMNRSTSVGGPTGLPFTGGRPSSMVRTNSQGGPGGSSSSLGTKRTRSKRGDQQRSEANRIITHNAPSAFGQGNSLMNLEPVAPLVATKDRWVGGSVAKSRPSASADPTELVDKKVRALLNKLTMEKFDSISDQIIAWANKSVEEKDGRTLIQVIRLVFEKATDEANWSEMYARLCRKMMQNISPEVQDDGVRNSEGQPITGGSLFRKYLLNRCQEDFERGWKAKETTAAAAASKASEDQATKEANEARDEKAGEKEEELYSEEYYAAQKAKRQGLGLVKFIGELFKLQMLTERIMHECIKKLLSNVENPEEEEIESLCKLMTTVGQALDTPKAHGHIDVYFKRMKDLARSTNVTSRMQYMLLDVIELRERKWKLRGQQAAAAPTTIAQVHEAAAREKAQQDSARSITMSRGGSRRGADRSDFNAQPDGWAIAGGSGGLPRPPTKAGDLSQFGKFNKTAGGSMTFGPNSVFAKKDNKGQGREGTPLSRTNSSSNMFSMLSGNPEVVQEAASTVSKPSRPPSRKPSVDLRNDPELPTPTSRPKLNLLPRSKPLLSDAKNEDTPQSSEPSPVEEEGEEQGGAVVTMTEDEARKKTKEDCTEFFAIRNLDEAEVYFTNLPVEHRHILVDTLVTKAIESKEADAVLVASFFERANEKGLCTQASFEQGLMPIAELLDDIAIDAPLAFSLMAKMLKGAQLDEDRRNRIASKSMDSDKLLALLT